MGGANSPQQVLWIGDYGAMMPRGANGTSKPFRFRGARFVVQTHIMISLLPDQSHV